MAGGTIPLVWRPDMRSVLVIDDCPVFRDRLRRTLQPRSFFVLEAGDVLAGLQRAVEDAPDLIVMAQGLSGLDGFEACERLSLDPASRSTPILLVTGCDSPATRSRARRAGALGVIPRAVDEARLLSTIGSALQLAAMPRIAVGNPARQGDGLGGVRR